MKYVVIASRGGSVHNTWFFDTASEAEKFLTSLTLGALGMYQYDIKEVDSASDDVVD